MTGIISRQYLYYTAYNVEADLRSLIYEHLTWLSFSFYDRVQSGQLISRANSDIRSVQMYSIFAPLIIVQCFIGVVAFGFMLSINWVLALIAMVVMPILYVVGIKMRRVMFPISWITQARLAEVATIVDENVNGVRVVKSFAQEEAEIDRLADAAEGVAWAYIKDANIRAVWSPWVQNLPQLGLALVLLCGGWMVLHGDLRYPPDPRLQPLSLDAPGPLHDARPAGHDGPTRQGERRTNLRDPRREPRDRRATRAPTTCRRSRSRSTSTT